MTSLPAWMPPRTQPADWATAPIAPRSTARRTPVRRAVDGFARLLQGLLADSETATRPGLLQGTDVRVKILVLLGLLVTITLVHSLPALAMGYAVCVTLAVASRLPARRFLGVWLAIPLFSAGVALPATLNLITPGTLLWAIWPHTGGHIGHWAVPPSIGVTDAGLLVAARFVLRTADCVSLAVLLSTTTPFPRLLQGLRALRIPQLFVMLLGMMERYLGVLVRVAEEIHLAKLSRTLATGDLRQEQVWVAAGMGALYRRSRALGDEVYLAMLSRGFSGVTPSLHILPRLRGRDWGVLVGGVLVGALVVWIR